MLIKLHVLIFGIGGDRLDQFVLVLRLLRGRLVDSFLYDGSDSVPIVVMPGPLLLDPIDSSSLFEQLDQCLSC